MPDCMNPVGHRAKMEDNSMTWPCILPAGHDGPCLAQEVPRSVRDRQAYDASQQDRPEFASTVPDLSALQPPFEDRSVPLEGGGRSSYDSRERPLPGNPLGVEHDLIAHAGGVDHRRLTAIRPGNMNPVVMENPEETGDDSVSGEYLRGYQKGYEDATHHFLAELRDSGRPLKAPPGAIDG